MPKYAAVSHALQTMAIADNQQDDWPKFDYESVPKSVATFLKGESERIRRQYTTSIVQIGKALLGAKRYLSHGSFIAWVEAEIGMPARTAQAYMRVAQWATDKSASVAHLPPAALYLLSASSTPPEFVRQITDRVEAGEKIALAEVRSALRDYRGTVANKLRQDQSPEQLASLAGQMDVTASLEAAVMIIARGLSTADFLQVKSAFTHQYLTEDPNFANYVSTLFSKVKTTATQARSTEVSDLDDHVSKSAASLHYSIQPRNDHGGFERAESQ
jgi:hypothetical protein